MDCRNNWFGSYLIQVIIAIILVILISSALKSCSRSMNDMVYIGDGYCYSKESHIIHKEVTTRRRVGRRNVSYTSYTPYYNEYGCLVKYNPDTGAWIPINTDQ